VAVEEGEEEVGQVLGPAIAGELTEMEDPGGAGVLVEAPLWLDPLATLICYLLFLSCPYPSVALVVGRE